MTRAVPLTAEEEVDARAVLTGTAAMKLWATLDEARAERDAARAAAATEQAPTDEELAGNDGYARPPTVTAQQLRAIGFVIPESIPDCAETDLPSIQRVVSLTPDVFRVVVGAFVWVDVESPSVGRFRVERISRARTEEG